jgi:hypothetical protein
MAIQNLRDATCDGCGLVSGSYEVKSGMSPWCCPDGWMRREAICLNDTLIYASDLCPGCAKSVAGIYDAFAQALRKAQRGYADRPREEGETR